MGCDQGIFPEPAATGRPSVNPRNMIGGILWRFRTGSPNAVNDFCRGETEPFYVAELSRVPTSADKSRNSGEFRYEKSLTALGISLDLPKNLAHGALFAWQYNGADQLTTLTRQNGNTGNVVPSTHFGYELATGRLASIEHVLPVGNSLSSPSWNRPLAGYQYAFDRDDRLISWGSLKDGTTAYSLDAIDQLTGADRIGTANDEAYTYDANGNRISSTLSGATANYDHGNR